MSQGQGEGDGEDLGALGPVLREVLEETRAPMDKRRSDEIFRRVMATVEQRQQLQQLGRARRLWRLLDAKLALLAGLVSRRSPTGGLRSSG